jgi:hypothetical protein
VCFFTRSESPAFSLIIYSLIINESTPKAFFTDRQTEDLNFETFLFRFFSWFKKTALRLHFCNQSTRARVFCSCCCCLNRGIDSKNDVVNEDCYQQKRFLFFVLPSSRSNIVETRENK